MTPEKKTPTSAGRPVTDEIIAALAQEAEAGYHVDTLKRRGGRRPMGSAAARVVPVRLEPELEEALRERADRDRSSTSDVIRDAPRAWLHSA